MIDVGTVTDTVEEERATVAPPDGAVEVSCTVPVAGWPAATVLGETATLLRAAGGAFTVTAAFTVTPEYEPEMMTGVALLTEPAVTVKVADVEPCGTVTEVGIATAVEDFDSVTEAPPAGAAAVSCTVPVADWPLVTVLGETAMLLSVAGGGLTFTAPLTDAPE